VKEQMEKIRTFIAIPLPPDVLEEFRRLISHMKAVDAQVKWVRPESIHLTLKFLGGVESQKLSHIFRAVETSCANFEAFPLKIATQGAFPTLKRPRVFWVGVIDPSTKILSDLQATIEESLAALGYPKEARTFKPHLTIGRVKKPQPMDEVVKAFLDYKFPTIEFTAGEVHVMRSQLTREGAIYSVQKSVKLKDQEG